MNETKNPSSSYWDFCKYNGITLITNHRLFQLRNQCWQIFVFKGFVVVADVFVDYLVHEILLLCPVDLNMMMMMKKN